MKRVAVAVSFVVALACVASANLLTNPGFELGDFTGWGTSGPGWRTTDWGDDVHSGSWGAVIDADGADEWRTLYQDVAVTAGLTYNASVWQRGGSIEVGYTESWLELLPYDSLGNPMWGDKVEGTHLTADQDFAQSSLTDFVAPAGAALVRVQGVVRVISDPVDNDYHIFDDFSFTESIPEPGTLAIMGLGIVGLFTFRRSRRN